MIYLFNSAYRPNYSKNVARTLFLPKGCVNEYRYKYRGARPNIDPTQVNEFKKLNRFYILRKQEVLICFIDRFAKNGYEYHPLRKGKLIKCYKDGDRLFFSVKLLDFVSPNENEEFNSRIVNIGNLPKLTNNDPENSNDGFYAIKNNDITKENNSFKFGSDAWEKITNDIKDTRSFASNDNQETVFARLSLNSNMWFLKNKFPKIKKDNFYFKITKSHKYTLSLYYKYPNQVNNNSISLKLSSKDTLNVLSEESIPIDNYTNNSTINISSKKYIEDNRDNLKFEFTSNQDIEPENLISPNYTFSFKISEGISFWIQILIAIVLFVLSEITFSIDYSQITTITFDSILSEITPTKLIGTSLKAITLFWIFRLVGKKIL